MIDARRASAKVLDAALEASIVGSFSKVGYLVRKHTGDGWTQSVPDLTGKVVLITGASSGLGRAAAEQLAGAGATLVLVGRNSDRLVAAKRACQEAGAPDVRVIKADLTQLSVSRRLVEQVLDDFDRLDVLIHNAGALVHDYRTTPEGFEETYAAQVLSQYVITAGLLPLLAATPGSRVIVVSSGGMYAERLDADTVQFDAEHYDGVRAYARAKRAQVALNAEWARRFADTPVVFHAMHPGWADTPGVAESLPGFRRVTGPFLRSPEEGADTIVWLASADEPGTRSGVFWLDRAPRRTVKLPWTKAPAGEAARLWDLVSEQTGVVASPTADVS
ncbi:MAG: SDR family NAD(P)-dependent oxidoreductase [Actinobacteria bacterium]|nr:SDR family NAD(P)-dependent oxidoreductase [Actinomycetota bacterium]